MSRLQWFIIMGGILVAILVVVLATSPVPCQHSAQWQYNLDKFKHIPTDRITSVFVVLKELRLITNKSDIKAICDAMRNVKLSDLREGQTETKLVLQYKSSSNQGGSVTLNAVDWNVNTPFAQVVKRAYNRGKNM